MKLDVNVLRYLSREDFRVLVAVEMGQKNVRRGRIGRQHASQPGQTALRTLGHCRRCCRPACRLCWAGLQKARCCACCFFSLVCLQHEIVPATLVDTIAGLK